MLELWSGGRLTKQVQVPKSLHGQVYADNWFGLGVAWSPDEDRIAYVAEVCVRSRKTLQSLLLFQYGHIYEKGPRVPAVLEEQ